MGEEAAMFVWLASDARCGDGLETVVRKQMELLYGSQYARENFCAQLEDASGQLTAFLAAIAGLLESAGCVLSRCIRVEVRSHWDIK